MDTSIFTIPLGFDRTYIVKCEGVIMIDGGAPKKIKTLIKGLKKNSVTPESIRLLILTHGHWDHIGSAKDIKNITGAKVAMHKREKDWLEKSLKPLAPGVTLWGRIVTGILAMSVPHVDIPATDVDIVLDDKDFFLDGFGIAGKVVPTPGHSPGSVSILLDTGEAFVGDLAMNAFPLRLTPGLPIFADDMREVKNSWKLLLDRGVKKIYPAHGNPFSAETIKKIYGW